MAFESGSKTHILLVGPPASAKTMFRTSLIHFKNAYFIEGGNSTKAGVFDYLLDNRPRFSLLDEIDKMGPKHITILLNFMKTGIISEMKYGKTREVTMDTSVFATSNDPKKLSFALLSRFFVIQVEPYTYDQFYEITRHLLSNRSKFAPTIADAVWNTTKNIRDCVRIGKLTQSEGDVKFLLDKFLMSSDNPGEK